MNVRWRCLMSTGQQWMSQLSTRLPRHFPSGEGKWVSYYCHVVYKYKQPFGLLSLGVEELISSCQVGRSWLPVWWFLTSPCWLVSTPFTRLEVQVVHWPVLVRMHFFLWCLAGIQWALTKGFYVGRLPLAWSFAYKEQAFVVVCACWCFWLASFSAPTLRYMR